MKARRARVRVLLFIAAAAASAGVVIGAYALHLLSAVEQQSVDARFAIRGRLVSPNDVVVVAIDAHSFNALNRANLHDQWPWPRRYHARLIDRIAAGHPKAIAIDLQFTEASDVRDDNALIRSVAKAGHVVLATTEVGKNGSTDVFGGGAVLHQIGASVGNASFIPDSDGVIRHVRNQIDGLTTFGLVAAAVAQGHAVKWPGGEEQLINFVGPPGAIQTYSYSDVYFGFVPPSVFKNKVVVIGPSAPSLQDVHATSTSGGQAMAGAEIQANVIESALHAFPLRNAPLGLGVVLIILFAALPALTSLRLRAFYVLAGGLLIGGLFTLATQFAFNHGRVVLFTYPLAALALSSVISLLIWYVLEVIERAVTRDAFARFVPAAVVDQVLARAGDGLRLGGEQVYGTVMFTDLRGFTSFSEGVDAEHVIGLLNRYLSTMTDAVHVHGGTLISYMGDGMMVVFGAPLPQPDHADRAVAAAREMLEERLPQYNEWLTSQGFESGFQMGIGINSGPFAAGNVGSEQRLEYTVIGDTTNTASRIEGMTKGTPYSVFLADSTREALLEDVDLVFVDELAVRGRQAAIKLWTLAGDVGRKEEAPAKETTPA